MGTPPNAGNQLNYQDQQPYQIDIDQIYNDFIKQIDAVRSYVNVSNTTQDSKILDAISGGSDQSIINFLTPNTTYQESRCHAFFRLIGFPVCDSSQKQIYNPGHPLAILGQTNTLPYKIQIARNLISGFRNFSITRERFPLANSTVFGLVGSINAAVLALTSGSTSNTQSTNLRGLDYSKVSGPFDLTTQNQLFGVGTVSLVGVNEVPFTSFQDVNGNTPNAPNATPSSRNHLVFPFIVDPIIDFCVNPATRRVGIPFVPDKTYLKVASGNAYAVRPLLEKVIRDRFTPGYNTSNTVLQPAQQNLIASVKQDPLFTNSSVVSQVFSNNLFNTSGTQFANFLNIINEMMHQLVAALITIQNAQSKYYWVPTMGATGPEGGVSVQDVFLPNNISSTLVTQLDRNLLNRIINAGLNQFNQQASQSQGIPDLGGFAFDSFTTTFNSDTSSALQDGNQLSADNMAADRKTVLGKAGDALRMVEIIMGEFSGFGLIDIMAIMGGLYIMPQNSLLGFLDQDAYVRAQNALGSAAIPSQSPATYSQAMTDLFTAVTAYYAIANSILKNWATSQGLSV